MKKTKIIKTDLFKKQIEEMSNEDKNMVMRND